MLQTQYSYQKLNTKDSTAIVFSISGFHFILRTQETEDPFLLIWIKAFSEHISNLYVEMKIVWEQIDKSHYILW